MKSVLCFLALSLGFASASGAEEWRYRSSETREVKVRDEGVLMRSGDGFLQFASGWVLRRDATGQVRERLRAGQSVDSSDRLVALPDRGWLHLAEVGPNGDCEIQRFDASGERLWRNPTDISSCNLITLYTDATGGWLVSGASSDYVSRRIQRLRPDGEWVPLDLTAAGRQRIEVLAQRDDGSFDLALLGSSQGLSYARLIGNRVEQVRPIEPSAHNVIHSAVSNDGSLWLVANGVDGDPADALMRFDADGRRQWRRPLGIESGRTLLGLRLVDDDVVSVVTSGPGLPRVQLRTFDRLGSNLATVDVEAGLASDPFPTQAALRPTTYAGAITLHAYSASGSSSRLSYNANGEVVALPFEHGGRELSSGWPEALLPISLQGFIAAHAMTSSHVDLVIGNIGAYGKSVDLRSRSTSWFNSSYTNYTRSRIRPITVVASDSRVCVGPIFYGGVFHELLSALTCTDRATGETLYRLDPQSLPQGYGALGFRESTSTLALDSEQRATTLFFTAWDDQSMRLERLRVSSDGQSREMSTLATLPRPTGDHPGASSLWRASLQPDGAALFAYPHPQGGLIMVQASAAGEVVQTRHANNELIAPKVLLDRGAAGAALIVEVSGSTWARSELWVVAASGALLHRVDLGDGGVEDTTAVLLEAAGQVLVARDTLKDVPATPGTATAIPRTARTRTVGSLDPQTGKWNWQRTERRVLGDRLIDMKIDAASGRAVLLADRSYQPRIELLDLASGDSRDVRSLRCPNSRGCVALAMRIEDDGQGRVLASVSDVQLGAQIEVISFDLDPLPTRPGVAGLAGLWYAPESGGQGLVLSTMPNANALLGGWFTYAENGVNRAADQRWYALEARYAPGARHLNVEVLRSAGGTFIADGAAVQEVIGHGELYLRSCGEAVLRYRFTAGDESGLVGEIPLLRLGPGGSDCAEPPAQLADGGGFSINQSGAWYRPEQGGQGLVMEVLPPAPGSPGLLSAGWFTFDPQAAANDPPAQHWFWIQGEIPARATGGEVELPIFNAIGGTLDTGINRNVREVGRARIRFTGCDRVELDFRFDAQAGAFADRTGLLQLSRLAGCADQQPVD
jgi:hypothetical protein